MKFRVPYWWWQKHSDSLIVEADNVNEAIAHVNNILLRRSAPDDSTFTNYGNFGIVVRGITTLD